MFDLKSHNKTKARRPDPDKSVFSDGSAGGRGRGDRCLGGPRWCFGRVPWVGVASARALTSALTLLRASCSSSGKPRTCRLSPL